MLASMKFGVKTIIIAAAALFGIADVTQAHLIGGSGFVSGIVHPFLGLDHVLTIIAVGIISTQIGGRVIWKVPAVFLAFMVIGGILGIKRRKRFKD